MIDGTIGFDTPAKRILNEIVLNRIITFIGEANRIVRSYVVRQTSRPIPHQ